MFHRMASTRMDSRLPVVGRGPRRSSEASTGPCCDQLERASYVERIRDPSDARARLVRITERGQLRETLARLRESPTRTPHPHLDTSGVTLGDGGRVQFRYVRR
jgi:hypothetical protein